MYRCTSMDFRVSNIMLFNFDNLITKMHITVFSLLCLLTFVLITKGRRKMPHCSGYDKITFNYLVRK